MKGQLSPASKHQQGAYAALRCAAQTATPYEVIESKTVNQLQQPTNVKNKQ